MTTTPTPPPPARPDFGDDPKATAAAAKAYAKAQRPWYKKKRFMIPLVLLIIAVIAAASGGGEDAAETTSEVADEITDDAPESDFSTNEEHPPAADVTVSSCSEQFGIVTTGLTITNNSSEASNYIITIGIENGAGEKIGDGFASTNNVDPGQTATIDGTGTVSEGADTAGMRCVLEEVERFAS
jgi:hypothetical protein